MPKDSTKTDSILGTVLGEDRRRFPRYPFIAYAEVTDTKPPRVRIKARTSDLGREGCYVDTISPFAVGTNVSIRTMKNDKAFSATGTVLYSTVGMGMGVIFTSVEPSELAVLENWLAGLSGESTEESEAMMKGQVQIHGQEQNEMRDLFGELIAALMRKRMLTDAEGKAMIDRLSRKQNLF
jgi:PilZ domain